MPLHYVDPNSTHSRWYTACTNFGRSRPGQFFARNVLFHVEPWLYRATAGRYPRVLRGPMTAPLTTTGAKTGQRRVRQLTYFHDGPDAILLASNLAKPTNPGWFYNLKAHADCQLGDENFVAEEVVDPAEYDRLFALAEQVFAGYAEYRETTSRIGRHIPVLRLTRH